MHCKDTHYFINNQNPPDFFLFSKIFGLYNSATFELCQAGNSSGCFILSVQVTFIGFFIFIREILLAILFNLFP